jgi:hypothetical protein
LKKNIARLIQKVVAFFGEHFLFAKHIFDYCPIDARKSVCRGGKVQNVLSKGTCEND